MLARALMTHWPAAPRAVLQVTLKVLISVRGDDLEGSTVPHFTGKGSLFAGATTYIALISSTTVTPASSASQLCRGALCAPVGSVM